MNAIETLLFITIAVVSVSLATATSCQSDAECLDTEQCDVNNVCINPCDRPHPELQHANCVMDDHQVQIECHDGYTQLPCTSTCVPIKPGGHSEGESCCTSQDCLPSLMCVGGKCFDSCKLVAEEEDEFCAIYNHTVVDMRLLCG